MQADDPAGRPPRPTPVLAPLVLAAALAVATAVLVLVDVLPAAGIAAALAGGASVFAGLRAREVASRPLSFADASAERVLDAVVLGAVAWAHLPDRPSVTAAALGALGASYLASYLAAKGTGLGFPLEESLPLRAGRWLILSVGLLVSPILPVALWVVAALSIAVVAVESASVARRREPR